MEKILRYWFPVVAWGALITLFSTDAFHGGLTYQLVRSILLFFSPDLSPQTIKLVHLGLRKLAHVLEYFVLALLLYRALRQDAPGGRHWRWALLLLLVTVGIASLDEVHQAFQSKRTASIADVGIDTAGALLALVVVWWRYRRAECKSVSHPRGLRDCAPQRPGVAGGD